MCTVFFTLSHIQIHACHRFHMHTQGHIKLQAVKLFVNIHIILLTLILIPQDRFQQYIIQYYTCK